MRNESCDRHSSDPETGVAPGVTGAAMCVQDVNVQCVLQFTPIHAAGCALHRHTSRVIHRSELSFSSGRTTVNREARATDGRRGTRNEFRKTIKLQWERQKGVRATVRGASRETASSTWGGSVPRATGGERTSERKPRSGRFFKPRADRGGRSPPPRLLSPDTTLHRTASRPTRRDGPGQVPRQNAKTFSRRANGQGRSRPPSAVPATRRRTATRRLPAGPDPETGTSLRCANR